MFDSNVLIAVYLTKLSEYGGLEGETFVELWFWLYGATLMGKDNLF